MIEVEYVPYYISWSQYTKLTVLTGCNENFIYSTNFDQVCNKIVCVEKPFISDTFTFWRAFPFWIYVIFNIAFLWEFPHLPLINNLTDRSVQTVETQIRLCMVEESDQHLHYLPVNCYCLHTYHVVSWLKEQKFHSVRLLGKNYSSFRVSEI